MKRLFTLFFVVSVLSATVWAADVSVEERFSLISSGNNSTAANYNGDLCVWNILANRRAQDTIVIDGKKQQCWWLNRANVTQDGSFMQTVNWEGGIKKVGFRCAQFGSESGNTLILSFTVGETTHEYTVKNDPNKNNGGETSSFNFNQKSGQLVIRNVSTGTGTGNATRRILVHYVTITPYLLYQPHNKYITLGVGQKGFSNYLIDNTGGGTITFTSSDPAVATIDANGVVTPVSAGTTTITASWEGVMTTYSLTIVNNAFVENFSKIGRVNGSITEATSWEGDICNWNVRYVRRGVADSIVGANTPRKQATWLTRPATSKTGYIEMPDNIEGGIKHLKFNWQQWASESGNLKFAVYYAVSGGSWGSAKATQDVTAASKGANFVFDEDIDASGSVGNARLKISNESYNGSDPTTARLVIENIQITPWVLYTDKKMKTIRVGQKYTNPSLIDNTSGEAEYESSDDAIATVDEYGQVTGVGEGYVTITAKYNNATTTYPMYIAPATNSETFSGESTAATYGTHTNVTEDATTWNTRLGGINYNENFAPNVVFLRAPKDDDTKLGYIESGLLDGGISKLTFYWNLVGNEPDVNKWDIRVLINGREVKRLTNDSGKELDGVTTRQANMTKCVIEDIDEPGRFTIRFENRSTMTGAYTSGNKARFVIDNLFWENHDAPIVLDEGVDNSALLTRNNGSTQDVNTNRTLVGGAWNTLCLPFNIDKTDLGEGVNVQTLDNASIEGDVLSIGFAALDGSTLTAGTPYLVKPESDVNLTGFKDKSIVSMNGVTSVGGGLVILQGIFSPTELTGGDRSVLFVGAEDTNGDNLFYPSVTANLNGMRAYFKINEAMGAPIRHARFVTDQTNTATGSEEVRSETVGTVRSEKILENGQLIIIRDGVCYDVLGRKK